MVDTTTSKHSITDLEGLYRDAEEQDKELYAEQRSNVLLYAGEHYNKYKANFFQRIRESKQLTDEQKLRLTKNHTQKIADDYTNHILSTAPGVGFEPANESELQDQKSAELNHAVWEFAREKHCFDEMTQNWAEDFVQIGEVAVKIFWDPQAGELTGYEPGQDGTPDNTKPTFSGEMVFERIFGFNLLVDPAATDHRDAAWMMLRKMVKVKKLKAMFPGEDNAKYIQESADQTYTIFDRGRAGYAKAKDMCMLREIYFKPSFEYPNGYCYFFVKDKILFESELPAGKFPIVFKPFRKLKTRARGQSIIKTIRPYQQEINRAASKIAEHQVTLGDDKILLQGGTTITSGKVLPGVRAYNVTGMSPTIMEGRDGSQYAAYLAQQITEMYNACGVDERDEPLNGQLDPYSLLYRSAKQKRRFKLYVGRFEQFLVEVAQLFLDLARYHYSDEQLSGMFGKSEMVNLAEFRNQDPLCYKIKVVAQSDDVETKLGKQLVLSQTLQYTASKFEREDIGKLIKAMPYSNMGEAFNDLTIDYEAATNDILALDRGELPPIGEFDNHVYMIKRLTQRMRQADFKRMSPQIQNNYNMRLQAHEQIQAEQLQKIQMGEAGFIPTNGYLVACDLYVDADPKNPSKTKRVRIPSGSLEWLIQKLETQGSSLQQLEQVNQGNLAQIADMVGGPAGAGKELLSQIPGQSPQGAMSGNGSPSQSGATQPDFAGSGG